MTSKKPKQRIGRPPGTLSDTGATAVTLRLGPDAIRVIDKWRREQPDLPSRPEAVRRMLSHTSLFENQ